MEMVRRAPATRPAPVAAPVRTRKAAPRRTRTVEKSGALKERRKKARKNTLLIILGLALFLLVALLCALWQPAFRVQTVAADGPDPEGMAAAAKEALVGTRFLLLPRNSIFFIPEHDIRAHVLAAYPAVQAVTIQATGLDALRISTVVRASSFTWCGESVETAGATCYQADAEGLIFAEAEGVGSGVVALSATSTATDSEAPSAKKVQIVPTDSTLLVYGPLEGVEDTPVRAHVTYASALPGALKFVKGMRALGADIRSVTLRGDEIDLHTKAGTRITYVIGKEGQAAMLAGTAFPSFKINDGSIEYVDLRFDNKIYIKRKAAVAQ
ncbi:MAG: hypothetical protein AAB883_00590 [Patescibacteria group bacterium]